MRLAHRARTSASPAQVWALLGSPARWPEFHPLVRRVQGRPIRVRTGDTLLVVARFSSVRIPVDVVEAEPGRRLELAVHTAPGLRERLVVELAPAVRGGTVLQVRTQVDGLFARPAAVPLWVAGGLVARVLAAQAERAARGAAEAQEGAA